MSVANANAALARNKRVLAGVDKYFGNVSTLTIGGTAYTPATLKAVFQGENDAETQLVALRAQITQVLAAARLSRAKARAIYDDLRMYILGTSGAGAIQMLEEFGMHPRTQGKRTAEKTAEAVKLAKATRKARNTLGKKQKNVSDFDDGRIVLTAVA